MSKNSQPLLWKRNSHPMRVVAATLLALLASGCNDYPVHSLLDSFGARVTSNLSHDTPVKLDFLWVIDHSTSMCKQQRILAQGFDAFIQNLQALGQVDAQMAVVTVQQIADSASAVGVTVKKVGEFNHTAARNFPPNCIEHYRAPCFVDGPVDATTPSDECRDGFDFQYTAGKNFQLPASSLTNPNATDPAGQHMGPPYGDSKKHYAPNLPVKDTASPNEWRCVQPSGLSLVTNDNGSINSYCQRHCSTDKECQDLFKDPAAICYTPGGATGDPKASGCMFPPNTKDCPDPDDASGPVCASDDECTTEMTHCVSHIIDQNTGATKKTCTRYLPSVIDNDHLNLFHCVATVGAASSQQSGFEGGLRSAWTALDPAGANCPGGPYLLDDNGSPQVDGNGKPLPNPNCQYAQLVRDDAYLVIVVVSDDDDCSVDLKLSLAYGSPDEKAALKALIPTEDWGKCQWLGDAVGGNRRLNEGNCLYVKSKQPNPADYKCPSDCAATDAACLAAAEVNVQKNRAVDPRFAPVSDFVNRFKSLKADPAHVIFAAIDGDSDAQVYQDGKPVFDADGNPVPDEAQKVIDTAIYFKSLRRNGAAKQSPYVCAGAKGESGYGSRYIEMVNAFRENGIFANICSGSDFSAPLNGIASTILKRIVKVCLPYPPDRDADNQPVLEVKRTRKGETDATTLQYTANTTDRTIDHFYIQSSPDCRTSAKPVEGESQPCKTIRDCATGLACIKNDVKDAQGLCRVYSEAIYFTEVPHDGDQIEINYGADLGFTAAVTTK